MEQMKLGDPLPDWFMHAMGKDLIVTHKCIYNGPFDGDMSTFCAFVWNGKSISVAETGDTIINNGDGSYTVHKRGD